MPERKNTGILSLNVKKLINLHLVWNTIRRLQWGSLFLITRLIKDCPHSLKPVFYRRYVGDIFVLFSSLDRAEKFKKYLSSKHRNINFSLEKENEGRLSFLDVNIFVKKESLSLMFIEKIPSVVFILTSAASYLKPIKPV